MIFDKYITIITFIPWILLYLISMIYNLNNKNYRKFNLKYFKKNIFKLFRIDTLFLIVVFYYFSSFDKEFVSKYLFVVICIYLFVNSFYEKKSNLGKHFFKDNILNVILLVLFMFIPLGFYMFSHKLVLTYKIMLCSYFLEYVIVLASSYITKGLMRFLKKA